MAIKMTAAYFVAQADYIGEPYSTLEEAIARADFLTQSGHSSWPHAYILTGIKVEQDAE